MATCYRCMNPGNEIETTNNIQLRGSAKNVKDYLISISSATHPGHIDIDIACML